MCSVTPRHARCMMHWHLMYASGRAQQPPTARWAGMEDTFEAVMLLLLLLSSQVGKDRASNLFAGAGHS